MHRAIPPAPIRFGQRRHVAAVGLHATVHLPIHRRVIRIDHDHLVPRRLQRPSHPLAFGPCLEHHPHPADPRKRRPQPFPRRRHALIADHGARRIDDPNLAIPHVQIDGTIDHGWLLLLECPVSSGRYSYWWSASYHGIGGSQPLHLIFYDYSLNLPGSSAPWRGSCNRRRRMLSKILTTDQDELLKDERRVLARLRTALVRFDASPE